MAEKLCERCGTPYITFGGRTFWCESCKIERFWDNVNVQPGDGCWFWTGATKAHGYGKFYKGYDEWLAHRFAYQYAYGDLEPTDCVLHACDQPACCRPNHLFKGSRTDNILDMVEKQRGRHRDGSGEFRVGLTERDVIDIRRAVVSGSRRVDLAEKYGVHLHTIHRIVKRQTWTHIA